MFFTAETIAQQFKLDIIKNEDTEFFEYENYDFEPNYNSSTTDLFPNSETLLPTEEKIKEEVFDDIKDTLDDSFDNHEDLQPDDRGKYLSETQKTL